MSDNGLPADERNAKLRVWQGFGDLAFNFNGILFTQMVFLKSKKSCAFKHKNLGAF